MDLKKIINGASVCILILMVSLLLQGSNTNRLFDKIGPNLLTVVNNKSNNHQFLIWICFTDKGSLDINSIENPENLVTRKSIERRRKVKNENNLVDELDLPVNTNYISAITEYGIKIKNRSKWFNSISCYATKTQIYQVIENDFVKKVELVKIFKKSGDDFIDSKSVDNIFNDNNIEFLNYGFSYQQVQQINVPMAHDSGYFGQDVLIAMFDDGVSNLQHPAFDSIRARGIRTYDFVYGDTNIGNQPGQTGVTGHHGTYTLSLICGYQPGSFIGPAFRSKFLLAATENDSSETHTEEDNWIAAAEWADSLGADIISSSLSYTTFDPGSPPNYNWSWMNGDSCLVTIGADIAVNKGIIVCNSAGNYGYNISHNTLGAPSDGDSVFAIGAVDSLNQRAGFSSVGNTVDNRIKPDFMARGVGIFSANYNPGSSGYRYSFSGGTSAACPFVAGVCALVLSARPDLTPMQVRNVLRVTSSNSQNPDRLMGWGVVNAWDAILEARTVDIKYQNIVVKEYSLKQNYPNPFNPNTTIRFDIPTWSFTNLVIYDIQGRIIETIISQNLSAGSYSVEWIAGNLSSGIYFYKIHSGDYTEARNMILLK